jgi:hypothetical protein
MTITLTREEAQQVLDALVLAQWVSDKLQNQVVFFEAEETLRARLAQPEPEPVADKYLMEVECTKCGAKQDGVLTVTAPPQREWQGLTDEEIMKMLDYGQYGRVPAYARNFVDAIEAKLKEKNT